MRRESTDQGSKKDFVKKLLPNPLNAKLEKREGKAIIAQDESELDDVVGIVVIAYLKLVNKNGDVVKYDYMKDYKGNSHTCLMTKEGVDDDVQDASSSNPKVSSISNPQCCYRLVS